MVIKEERREGRMNDRQLDLIMQIIDEQLSDYLCPALVEEVLDGIRTGIVDNIETLDQLKEI